MFGSNKSGEKYFDSLIEMCGYSADAVVFLKEVLSNYDPENMENHKAKMHAIEHDGDVARHTMFRMLVRESKLPIEREDMIALADAIDTVTDSIEDVLLSLYMFNVKTIRPEIMGIVNVACRVVKTLCGAMDEFRKFRSSPESIREKIIEINNLEEQGDRLYIEAMRGLYVDETLPPLAVTTWAAIFGEMEDVVDSVEDAANVIESVIMKNA